jgi:hypothetical protein
MRLFCIILILYFLSSCQLDVVKTSLNLENLKGKVKTVKEFWLEKKGVKNLASSSFFNQKGFITEIHEFGESGSIVEKVIYNYDEKNLLLSKSARSGDGALKWRLLYNYNGTDSLVSINLLGADSVQMNSTNHRFVGGEILNPVKENKYQFGENHYDTNGNLIEMKMLNNQFVFKYKYSNRLLIEVVCYGGDNKQLSREIYKYDSKNNLTEKRNIQASGKLTGLYSYEYQFDAEGNWIAKQEFFNRKLVTITERSIEYY